MNGSLFLVADHIDFSAGQSRGEIHIKPKGEDLRAFTRRADGMQELHRHHHKPGGDSVVFTVLPPAEGGNVPFTLSAQGVHTVEWYNAEVSCPSSRDCPTGGGPYVTEHPSPPGYRFKTERQTYEALQGPGLTVEGAGSFDYAVFGSEDLTVGIDGSVRLPLSHPTEASQECPSCLAPQNQTFQATGNITLANLRMGPGSTVEGELAGDVESAWFDETPVDPQLLSGWRLATGGAAAAAAGAVVLLKYVLWPLFTKRLHRDPLAGDRRRQVHGFVLQNPGANFSDIVRGTGLAVGTVQHNLGILTRLGLLVERRHRSSARFFAKGTLPNAWRAVGSLRDPKLRQIHDWVAEHPGSTQKQVLSAFQETQGWSASTTQGRLARLVEDGAVQERTHGRRKTYAANPTEPPHALPLPVAQAA